MSKTVTTIVNNISIYDLEGTPERACNKIMEACTIDPSWSEIRLSYDPDNFYFDVYGTRPKTKKELDSDAKRREQKKAREAKKKAAKEENEKKELKRLLKKYGDQR